MLLFLAEAVPSRAGTGGILPILLIIAAVFYFVKIHPTNKYRKKVQQLRSETESIDKFTVVGSEEKILIKSERYNISKFLIIFTIIGIFLSVVSYITEIEDAKTIYDSYYEHCQDLQCGWPYEYYEKCYACEGIRTLGSECLSESEYAAALVMREEIGIVILPALICAVISFIVYLWLRSYELTVTDKRIYGKVAWGKRVDLPIDSVSATATITLLKGVSVSTSSGRISFLVMKNAEDIYKTINELLIKRQSKPVTTTTIKQEIPQSNADELKKYKELLDMGIITQEEFDAKKKQLLGL